MEFIINAIAFKTLLIMTKDGLPQGRASHSILEYGLFEVSKGDEDTQDNDELACTFFNLALGVTGTVPCQVIEPGATCIPAKKLLEYIPKASGDLHCQLIENDGELTFEIAGASGELLKLPCLPIDEFPTMPEVSENRQVVPLDICQGLAKATLATAKDETKQALCHVHLETSRDTATIASTDGHVLFIAEYPYSGKEINLNLPKDILKALGKLLAPASKQESPEIQLAYNEKYCLFMAGNYSIFHTLPNVTYPDFKDLVPKDMNGYEIQVVRKDLQDITELVGILSRGDNNLISLTIGEDLLRVDSKESEIGNAKDSIPAGILPPSGDITGICSELWVNFELLQTGLKILNNEQEIRMNWTKDAHRPITLSPMQKNHKEIFLLMPVKLRTA